MEFVNVLGYQVRYLKLSNPKSNETLVLLHGLGASADRWSELKPFLKDYNVVIPDIIGFGYSEKPLIHYEMSFFIKFLDEFFYKLNINNPIAVGSSFGGQLVLEYYFKNKDFFKKIILVSPAGTAEKPTFVLRQYIFSSLFPTFENTKIAFKSMAGKNYQVKDSTIKDFINRMKLPNAKHALISTVLALRKNNEFQNNLRQVNIPTIVIWGEVDTFIPISNLEYFKEIPNVKIAIMPECGHSPFVEKPLEFYKIIKNFIDYS